MTDDQAVTLVAAGLSIIALILLVMLLVSGIGWLADKLTSHQPPR